MPAGTAALLGCLLGLLLLCGCKVDQRKEIETYRQVTRIDDEVAAYDPGTPLTLRRAMLLTNQVDESLASRGEQYLQSIIQQRRAIASFLPTVDLVPVYSRRERVSSSSSGTTGDGDSGDDGGSTGGGSSPSATFDAPVQGSINLFNGFSDLNRARRDDFVVRQRRFELTNAQEQVLLDAASVFYQVLRSEASVRVLESALQLQAERLRDARVRLEAGIANALVASQTEAQIAQTQSTLISARNDVVQARSRLRLLTDAEVEAAVLVDTLTPPEPPPLNEWMGQAYGNRDDLRATSEAVTAAAYDVRAAIGQYYPSVTLDVTAYLYRESTPTARSWDGALRANLPILSGGRIEADVRERWSFLRQALLSRNLTSRTIRADVEQAHAAFAASTQRLAQLQVQVRVAGEALRQAEEQFRAGIATNLDRIQAQDAAIQAGLQLASEEFDRKLFYLTLLQRAGVLREQFEPGATTRPAAGAIN
ncbi:MAG TPA: TolC family protein [Tepidisphaeraceae bacterium]